MQKAIIEIEGMTCMHCSRTVKNLIEEVEGVASAEVDLSTNKAIVDFDDSASTKAIIDNINSSETFKAKLI